MKSNKAEKAARRDELVRNESRPPLWDKIEEPEQWTAEIGESITGQFVNVVKRDGSYGTYEMLILRDDMKRLRSITGAQLITLVAAAGQGEVTPGTMIRVKYKGNGTTPQGRTMKVFDLHVLR